MAFTDITPQFREIVSRSTIPNAKRRKVAKGTQKSAEGKEDVQALLNKEYVQEAYNIVRWNQASLAIFVFTILILSSSTSTA